MINKLKSLVIVSLISSTSIFCQNLLDVNSVTAIAAFNYVSEDTKGEIKNISAKIIIDTNDLQNSTIEGKANINFISTSNAIRDKHLKSKTYFYIKEYPEIEFKSDEITLNNISNDTIAPITSKGNLYLKGFKKPMVFDLFYTKEKVTLKAKMYADDFGVAVKPGRENSLVEIEITIER